MPKLRFKGFTDDWEQRKLGDVVDEFYNGQTPYRQNKIYWDGDVNWLSSGDLNRGIVTHTLEKITEEGKAASGLKIVPKGTLVIAIMGLEAAGTRGNCGILAIDTTINQACMALIVDGKQMSSNFLFQWYKCFGNAYALKFTQGTKQQNYNAELLADLDISYPRLEEQMKIGEYFSTLDNLITLHQRKCDELQKVKKYMLQKMFPKKGEKIPEIRFAGFFGDWEQRKLGEMFNVIDTKHATAPITWDKTRYRMIRTDCVRNGRLLSEKTDSVTEEIYEQWSERIRLRAGDLVFTREAPMGESAVIPSDDNLYFPGQRIVSLRPKVDADTMFINNLIYADEFRKEIYIREAGSSTVANFGIPHIKEHSVMVPDYAEQHKIGSYLNRLDNLITFYQHKCDTLKETKKYMLQNMFPKK